LRLGRRFDRITGCTQQGVHLCRRQQADVLGCQSGLLAVHDNHDGDQRFLRDASPDVREIDGLLDVGGEQYREPCVGSKVHGLVPGTRSGTVPGRSARPYVQDERHVFAGCRNQQILGSSNIGTGKKCRCAASGKR
jgi:hypothetical protein